MGSGRSWNHKVCRLDPADVDRNDRFGATCATGKCTNLPTHATRWDYVTGRAGRVSDVTHWVCTAHAETFATKHTLNIADPPPPPGPPQTGTAGELEGVRLRSADGGRHWYMELHRSGGDALESLYRRPLFGSTTIAEAIPAAEADLAAMRVVPAGPWQRSDGEATVDVIAAHRHQQWSARPWQLAVTCDASGMWWLTRSLDERFAPITDRLGDHNMSLGRALKAASALLAEQRWATRGWVTSQDNTARQDGWHPDQATTAAETAPVPGYATGCSTAQPCHNCPGCQAERDHPADTTADPSPATALLHESGADSRPAGPFPLILTGSRTWTDAGMVERSLDAILSRHPEGVVVVHGANPAGADAIADAYASRTPGFTVERHPADWYGPCRPQCQPGHRRAAPGDARDYCPAAGNYRNREMADLGAGGCVAFHHHNSPGTADMIRAARQRGIPLWVRAPGAEPGGEREWRPNATARRAAAGLRPPGQRHPAERIKSPGRTAGLEAGA